MSENADLRAKITEEFEGHLDRYSPTDTFACIFCGYDTTDPLQILFHLAESHNFAIDALSSLSLLQNYLQNWRIHVFDLVDKPLYGRVMSTIDPSNPDEIQLRKLLHNIRLDRAMQQFEFERTHPNDQIKCLFCDDHFQGTWHDYLQWLFDVHGFNPGRPSNLVFIPELVDHLRTTLSNKTCFFCLQTFPTHEKLKTHVRKKSHDKIPAQKCFDRHYLVNYLDPGCNWKDATRDGDGDEDDEENLTLEEKLRDFGDEIEVSETLCLVCDLVLPDPTQCRLHMAHYHGVDLGEVRVALGGDFYRTVSFVNYDRSQNIRAHSERRLEQVVI
jgi:hypothetical protein